MTNKVGVFYDYLAVRGGAEAVFEKMLDLLCPTRGIVDFVGKQYRQTEITKTVHSIGYPLPGMLSHFITPLRFRFLQSSLLNNDVNIFAGIYAPLAVERCFGAKKLYYCHTPPRHLYDLRNYYSQNGSTVHKLAIALQGFLYKTAYESAVKKMDRVIANSENVKKRLKQYLNIESTVIYPPCETGEYTYQSSQGYYLSTARLEPYKRIDLILQAFKKMPDKNLIIISGGSELVKLRRLAQYLGMNNVEFTGWLTSEQKKQLVNNCLATIYIPKDEDFGMSPVESMAAGKPVIGVAEGGLLETLVDGVTGVLCPAKPGVDDLVAAISTMTEKRALQMKTDCQQRAELFSVANFNRKILELIG